MNREVELAKKILESKGYKVSRLKESSYNYSGHNVSDDLQQYLVTVVLGGTDGDGETGMIEPDYYTELVSAIDEEDAKHQVEKVLDPGDGITEIHLATPEEIAEWEHSAYEYMDEAHTVELYKTHTGEPERKRFIDYKSAKEFADSNTENYEEILITIPTVNGPSTVNSWNKSDGWYRTVESKKMNESIKESDDLKYIGNTNGYLIYRKIENGKGVWFAKRQDDSDDKMFPISYDQARGFKEMPDETEIEKLQRKMGKMLLPQNESVDDRQQRRIVRRIANEVIQSRGENNSIGTYDAFIRKMIDNWATSGHDRDFIKAAIEKSFDKEFRVKESQVITISKPDDLVGHNPKFRVTYSAAPGETTSMTIEATDERAVEAIISGRFKRRGKTPPKFLSIERVSDIKESSESPHTESYRGYSIQSYDDFGATVYKNGKKIREFENIDDAREYIDGLTESINPLQKAILKSIKRLHESSGLDYDEMQYWNPIAIGSKVADYLGTDATQEEIESEISKILDRSDSKFQRAVDEALHQIEIDKESMSYDPMQGNKYHIGGSTPNVTETGTDYDIHDGGYTDDPELAIIKWLRLSKNSPMSISIDTNKNAHAQELLQWVVDNEEKFRKLCAEYNCPYKIDYMIDECKKKLERPSNFETKYNYPDQIYPFAIG